MMNNATTERTALRRKTRVALSLAAFLLFHFLVSPVWCQNGATVIVTVAKSTPEFTRKSEGDVIELDDGRLLLVYMEFSGTGSDFAKTRLVAQESSDGGRTWGRHRVITETTPGDMKAAAGGTLASVVLKVQLNAPDAVDSVTVGLNGEPLTASAKDTTGGWLGFTPPASAFKAGQNRVSFQERPGAVAKAQIRAVEAYVKYKSGTSQPGAP